MATKTIKTTFWDNNNGAKMITFLQYNNAIGDQSNSNKIP